ncbi:MAG: DUF5615 family PIN-like protein [Bryobacteraceae bacterium]|nr:DUF5615 family PIN-like protein [Bryobacteraceae bacterium]
MGGVDENFNNNILRALVRRNPRIDILRVRDAGLAGADDSAVLAWAAYVSTITAHAYEQVRPGGLRCLE